MVDEQQRVDTRLLYGIVADAMPMEGRDFTLEVGNDEDGKPKVTIKPLTDAGKAFAPLLIAKLADPMGAAGVAVAGVGVAAAEVLTVRKIREKVEADATAARRAKIAAAESGYKAKLEALENARKARIEKASEKSPVSQEELAAELDVNKANAELHKAKALDAHVTKIRARVDTLAKAEAEKDERTGRSWAVDMDAPLKTQFDRRDAISKFSEKERLIEHMAELAANQDALGGRAVALAKQYIIHKKK